jgi:transcriptional regulator with XRE-family HTH domain
MANPIGERIKALRKGKDWGQELLAEKMNVVQSLVAKIEVGSRKVTVEEAIRLAELFETSTDFILRGIEPDFVNVASDLGMDAAAIGNMRNVHKTPRRPENANRLDNQDVANFLMSYDGWAIVDTICEYLNTPQDKTVNVPNTAQGELHCVNLRSVILAKLQDILLQKYDTIKRRDR